MAIFERSEKEPVKDANNQWKYETDTNSSCTELEFNKAKSL